MKHSKSFGDDCYQWKNKFHPENPNFMQNVYWVMFVKPCNSYSIGYTLDMSGNPKIEWVEYGHINKDMQLSDLFAKYKAIEEDIEAEYKSWLLSQNK